MCQSAPCSCRKCFLIFGAALGGVGLLLRSESLPQLQPQLVFRESAADRAAGVLSGASGAESSSLHTPEVEGKATERDTPRTQQAEEATQPAIPINPAEFDISNPPKVYVYELNRSFRHDGQEDCSDLKCAFGGPPEKFRGMDVWHTSQFLWPWQLFYRLLRSPHRTLNVTEADVFYVPAWSRNKLSCPDKKLLWEAMKSQNPFLVQAARNGMDYTYLHRHLLVDPRTVFVCPHLSHENRDGGNGPGFQYMFHLSLEEPEHTPLHFDWYAFPYPSFFHGRMADAPAATRPRGHARYLWQYNAGVHGWAQNIRRHLEWECGNSTKCAPSFEMKRDLGDLNPPRLNLSMVAEEMLQSTYCVHPPGDTPSRKGIIDSIIMGCVPVLFINAQMNLWRGHFTPDEFESMVVFVPEEYILGDPVGDSRREGISKWEQMCGECSWKTHPSWQRLIASNETLGHLHEHKLQPILEGISVAELEAKQGRLAELCHRVILQLEDGERDSLRVLLEQVVRDATKTWRLRRRLSW